MNGALRGAMRFGLELGAFVIAVLAAYAICRWSERWAWAAAAGSLLAALAIIVLGALPEEDALWATELFSHEWVRLIFGCLGGIMAGASIAGMLRRKTDRFRRLGIAAVVAAGLAIALWDRQSEIFFPLEPLTAEKWAGDACLQTTGATCGPASLASCLRSLGITVTEREMAFETNTTEEGAYFSDLARAVRRRGLRPVFHQNEPVSQIPLPAIAGTDIYGIGHFVAIVEKNGERLVADPSGGFRPLTSSNYRWTGICLSISR